MFHCDVNQYHWWVGGWVERNCVGLMWGERNPGASDGGVVGVKHHGVLFSIINGHISV